jgi:CheY-like chemotaxis protein/HPt (histidine-containing phosphotransfer) domain-containing protein
MRDDGSPRLRFDISDTGIGMNEEQIGKLFRTFTQVDNSAARRFGGSGLGLCISKRLTEAMGGNIVVHSTPGKGSTFSIAIDPGPLEGIRMVQPGQRSVIQSKPLSSSVTAEKIQLHGRILLAEDGPDNQRLIGFILEKAGAKVTTVENGRLALEAAMAEGEAGEPFDLILMDMQMPVMDGYAATRELRARGYAAPIVALTAHAMAEDRRKCLEAGCNDYATKPIDRQKLLATVAHWTGQNRTSANSQDPSTTENKENASPPRTFVYSRLAADPNLAELVDLFVLEMPSRIHALETQAKVRDWNKLSRIAHQIKGSAGSYGFDEITPYAARLEDAASEALDEEKILSALSELLRICRSIRSGTPAVGKQQCLEACSAECGESKAN